MILYSHDCPLNKGRRSKLLSNMRTNSSSQCITGWYCKRSGGYTRVAAGTRYLRFELFRLYRQVEHHACNVNRVIVASRHDNACDHNPIDALRTSRNHPQLAKRWVRPKMRILCASDHPCSFCVFFLCKARVQQRISYAALM